MGYAYSVYGVDLAKLKALWGCKDAKLAAAIKKKHADRIDDNTESFEDEIEDEDAPTLGVAIDEIFAGKCKQKDHGFQYGYALELLCHHLGKRIDEESLSYFDDWIDPLLGKAKHSEKDTQKLIGANTFPIKIPEPADFPTIGTLDDAGMKKLDAALDKIEPLATDDDAKEIIKELRGWTSRARKAKRQIVWFVY
jgi:hypothetical protein